MADLMTFIAQVGIGGPGTQDGAFDHPRGIVEVDGYLYITDTDNNRIKRHLASTLAYVSKVGTFGTGNDNFNQPTGICSDESRMYIIDSGNNRIVKRNLGSLTYVSQIGSYGSGNDQFKFGGLNVGAICCDGNWLYVYDGGNARIQKRLCSTLAYVSHVDTTSTVVTSIQMVTDGVHIWVADLDGDKIEEFLCSDLSHTNTYLSGSINTITGIASNGKNFFLTDNGASQIKKYNTNFSHIVSVGSTGSAIWQLNQPFNIAARKEFIYIVDYNNHRIVKRWAEDPQGDRRLYINDAGRIPPDIRVIDAENLIHIDTTTGTGGGNPTWSYVRDCEVDDNYLYVVDSDLGKIIKYDRLTYTYISDVGSPVWPTPTYNPNDFCAITSICEAGLYLYVFDKNRISKRLKSDLSYVADNHTDSPMTDFIPGQIQIDSTGTYLYAVGLDSSFNTILVKMLASNLSVVLTTSPGDISGYPDGISISDDGTKIYVSDTYNDNIKVRSTTDFSAISNFGTTGTGNDQFQYPYKSDLANDVLWQSDESNHRVKKILLPAATYGGQFGQTGVDGGGDAANTYLLSYPRIVKYYQPAPSAGETGFLYILNYGDDTLQKRDLETFALLLEIGSTGSGDNQFSTTAYAVANICTDGTFIYVADTGNNRIKKHRADDLSFVQKTTSVSYDSPSGICYSNGKIYFQDWGNYRIVVLDANNLTTELGTYDPGSQPLSPKTRVPGTLLEGSGLTTDDTNLWSSDFTDFWGSAPPDDWQSPLMKLTLGDNPSFDSEYTPHRSSQYYATPGLGLDEDQVKGIHVKGNYLYMSDYYGNRITVRNKSNFVYVSAISDEFYNYRWYSPRQISSGDNNLYFVDDLVSSIVRVDLATLKTQEVYNDANLNLPIGIVVLKEAAPPGGPNTSGQVIW